MPIDYEIDHEQRLVIARGRGNFSTEDIFTYQREAWSRSDVAGYDELVDMTAVETLPHPPPDQLSQLARLSASMDPRNTSSRLAIVASRDLAFALGRMYQTYRGLEERSTKKVGVFRTFEEAVAFLANRTEESAGE